MENIWLISIVALVVGAVIGFLMGRSGGNSNRQAELSEQLDDTKKELENYKSEVNSHFEKTAELVNNLTHSYQDVHQHLASGAQGLCQPGTINMALEPASMQAKLEDDSQEDESAPSEEPQETGESSNSEQPRDYAPKSPDEEGTLSETFGLKDEEKTEAETTAPADATPPKEEKATA